MKFSKLSALIAGATMANTIFAAPPANKNPLADIPFYNRTETGYDLVFNDKNGKTMEAELNGEKIRFYGFEKIVYVANPVEPEYQTINFYVPEAYFVNGEINGYKANTAPIFLPNSVGGYMPALAATANQPGKGGKPSTILTALSKGYVVASVGTRGRTLGTEGNYTGKAPAVIVDLKAAVRYLHANDALMAGDANKIISNGTSAGGAMSALLGASGDNRDFEKYLAEAGALQASDAIFAVSAYCPITDLEHADMAYEWEFNGVNEFSRMDLSRLNAAGYNDRSQGRSAKIEGKLSDAQIKLSDELKANFPHYLNSLNLTDEKGNKLSLDKKGDGSFKEYMKSILIQSANRAVKNGTDFTDVSWVKMESGQVTDIDWNGYIHSEKRMKLPPAFDALDLSSGENNFFGDQTINNKHFTKFTFERSSAENVRLADSRIVSLVNAMNYTENKAAAQYWRIRTGTSDRDTSHAISAILAVKLKMSGKNVDYALPWGVPHSGDYDLQELFQWADSIVKGN